MEDKCQHMRDLIIDYVNTNIDESDKIQLVNHLSICPECRKELAMTLKLNMLISSTMSDVPKAIMESAFSLIPRTDETIATDPVAKLKSSLDALKVIPYALSATKKSIKLALQFI
ncbi:MAG: zf-HC2 domain-containing protein [Tissierellales bacterium]